MKRISVLAILAVAIVLALPPAALAQTFYGLSAGWNYGGPAPSGASVSQGFAVQASIGRRVGPRFAWRIDAFESRFADVRPTLVLPCPSVAQNCGAGFSKAVGLAALALSGVIYVTPPEARVGTYVIAGTGVYWLYEHPDAAGAVRPELSAGGGVTLQVATRSYVFIEARYYALLGAPSQPTWLLPVTFGIRL